MEIGIDSFASVNLGNSDERAQKSVQALEELIERMVKADEVGLDFFGLGEHHRAEFLDSANTVILAAAAALTKKIKLSSAVTVLSAADPVRVFQSFATLDLISKGRAEMVVGRGSFTEAFPLFGYNLNDYDELFAEKLDLLLQIKQKEIITWKGKYRSALQEQAIYPRPFQKDMPIWLGVGGTPASFARAGTLGMPLMVAVIGGETHRFKPLVDLYREAGKRAGHAPEKLKVGLHSLGYVSESTEKAISEYYPGYAKTFTRIGRERGWPPVTFERFAAQNGPTGAYLVGNPKEIAEKILRHSEALGGIDRFTFQMDNADLSHALLLNSIALIGNEVAPLVRSGKV
jgi:probable LLM family oxidoreductase